MTGAHYKVGPTGVPVFLLLQLRNVADTIATMRVKSGTLLAERDRIIREAYADGIPSRAIARAAGVSRATVQRICDLSEKGSSDD